MFYEREGLNFVGCGIFYKDILDFPQKFIYDMGVTNNMNEDEGDILSLYSLLSTGGEYFDNEV